MFSLYKKKICYTQAPIHHLQPSLVFLPYTNIFIPFTVILYTQNGIPCAIVIPKDMIIVT